MSRVSTIEEIWNWKEITPWIQSENKCLYGLDKFLESWSTLKRSWETIICYFSTYCYYLYHWEKLLRKMSKNFKKDYGPVKDT